MDSATAAADPTAMRARKLTLNPRGSAYPTPRTVWISRGAPRVLGLAAEVPDVDVERVRGRAEVVAPHALEDDRSREHLARVAQEELEQRELGSRELDRASPRLHLAGPEIELEVGEAQHVVAVSSPFPARRSRARRRASSSASANGFGR